jgi:hypothetical protein
MKRIAILILAAALALTFAWLAGCSSNSTNSTPKTAGDTTSVQFQTVSDAFDMADGVDGMVINGTFELIGTFFAPAAPRQNQRATAADPVFHEASMYWYCVNTATETTFVSGHPDSIENISEWTRIDSLQFLNSGTPSMFPNMDSLSEIKAGVQLDGYALMTDDSIHATRHIDIAGEPGSLALKGDVTINAGGTTSAYVASTFYHNDTATTCQLGINMVSAWRNLAANLSNVIDSGGCPSAGSITWAGQLALDCVRADDTLSVNGGWTYLQTFNGTQVTRVFENATTRWTVTDSCGARQQLSPLRKSANLLR